MGYILRNLSGNRVYSFIKEYVWRWGIFEGVSLERGYILRNLSGDRVYVMGFV